MIFVLLYSGESGIPIGNFSKYGRNGKMEGMNNVFTSVKKILPISIMMIAIAVCSLNCSSDKGNTVAKEQNRNKLSNKAIALKNKKAEAYYKSGLAYAEKGDYDKAIKDYTKAIELDERGESDPNLMYVYNNRGHAYADKGDYDKAIKDWKKYLELNPDADDRDVTLELIEKLQNK